MHSVILRHTRRFAVPSSLLLQHTHTHRLSPSHQQQQHRSMVLVACQRQGGAYLNTLDDVTVLSCIEVVAPVVKGKKTATTAAAAAAAEASTYDVELSDTVCFPQGGGQPFDMGLINGIRCLSVERKAGSVIHKLESPLPVDTKVSMSVDWARRYDHMQLHSTQHLISAVALKLFGFKTMSWRLTTKPDDCYIQFATPTITAEQSEQLQTAINDVIRAATPVNLHIFESYEAALLDPVIAPTLRLGAQFDSNHTGELRVVEWPGIDVNACCGTHLKNASEIQVVVITKLEFLKKEQATVLSFTSGQRAVEQLANGVEVGKQLSLLLSVGVNSQVEAVTKVLAEYKQANKQNERLLKELAALGAQSLLSQHAAAADKSVLLLHKQESTLAFLQDVADIVYTQLKANAAPVMPVLLFTATDSSEESKDNNGSIIVWCDETDKAKVTAVDVWFKSVMTEAQLNGKGGGKPGRKQGKSAAMLPAIIEAAAVSLRTAVTA